MAQYRSAVIFPATRPSLRRAGPDTIEAPRRRSRREDPLKTPSVHLHLPPLLVSLCLLAHPLTGQNITEGADSAHEMRGAIGSGFTLTTFDGDAAVLLDLSAGLEVTPHWTVGGAGHLLLGRIGLGEVDFRELDLELGYGGLVARREGPGPFRDTRWYGSLLVGAGNADLEDAATGFSVDSDNFFVVEPSVGVTRDLLGRVGGALGVSYRWVTGADGLEEVDEADLRAFAVRVTFHIRSL